MEMDMLHAAGQALVIILDPHRLIYLFAGVCMGLGLGLLPGIGGDRRHGDAAALHL